MAWNVDILTLYPDMFPGHLDKSLSGKALKQFMIFVIMARELIKL